MTIKLKLPLHKFNAFNTAVLQYIPSFLNSNRIDIRDLPEDSRERLSRRVLLSLVEGLHLNLQKLQLKNSENISIKMSEAECIALFYLLRNIPIQAGDIFTYSIINQCIQDIHRLLIQPSYNQQASSIFKLLN
ncbi:MAG: hypothetical protein J0H76_05050 [Sphingobacteriales bacterium]|nr:hypothetical protein [Sphingobacteriales bacterium]